MVIAPVDMQVRVLTRVLKSAHMYVVSHCSICVHNSARLLYIVL